MKFQYADCSPTITHLKSGMEFVVSYDDGDAPLKAIANPTTAAGVDEREITKLSKEAFTHVQNVCNRAELKRLADRYFSLDLSEMLPAFASGDYDKEVSTRTLQSWIAPIERASSRTCPAWAVDAVRKYIESNKETIERRAKRGLELNERGYSWRRDNQLLADADALASQERAKRDRFTNCSVPLFSRMVADEFVEQQGAIEAMARWISDFFMALEELSDDATMGDLKAKLRLRTIEGGLYSDAVKKTSKSLSKPDSDIE